MRKYVFLYLLYVHIIEESIIYIFLFIIKTFICCVGVCVSVCVHFKPKLELLHLYKPGAEDRCQSKETAVGHLR